MWTLEGSRLDFEFQLSHLQACDLGKSYELAEIQFLHLSNKSNIIDHSEAFMRISRSNKIPELASHIVGDQLVIILLGNRGHPG